MSLAFVIVLLAAFVLSIIPNYGRWEIFAVAVLLVLILMLLGVL